MGIATCSLNFFCKGYTEQRTFELIERSERSYARSNPIPANLWQEPKVQLLIQWIPFLFLLEYVRRSTSFRKEMTMRPRHSWGPKQENKERIGSPKEPPEFARIISLPAYLTWQPTNKKSAWWYLLIIWKSSAILLKHISHNPLQTSKNETNP